MRCLCIFTALILAGGGTTRQADERQSVCLGYSPLSPETSKREGCVTGGSLGSVNQEQALGLGSDADLRSCGFPDYPDFK